MSYFPEPYCHSKDKIKVELDFSNYATKSDLKSATGIDLLKFSKKADLVTLKSDIDKLETTPIDLSKLSNVVKRDAVKKRMYMMNYLKTSMLFRLSILLKSLIQYKN